VDNGNEERVQHKGERGRKWEKKNNGVKRIKKKR
jgi:hypothetical protein